MRRLGPGAPPARCFSRVLGAVFFATILGVLDSRRLLLGVVRFQAHAFGSG